MECTVDGCKPKQEFRKYYVSDYGFIQGEQDMLNEIVQNGPIVCSCAVPEALKTHSKGVFVDNTGRMNFDHECEIVGFGVEKDVKYWHVKNTWGTSYGEHGFFKVIRGINNIAIETNCSWANPLDTWSEGKEAIVKRLPVINSSNGTDIIIQDPRSTRLMNTPCRVKKSEYKNGARVKSTPSQQIFERKKLPKNFDWRNVFGFNYVSWTTNQNVPHYCDSCWAFAPTSALADRFMILSKRSDLTFALNPQALINCKAGGSCQGGNPAEVYEFAHIHGIPDSSCFNYEGINYNET